MNDTIGEAAPRAAFQSGRTCTSCRACMSFSHGVAALDGCIRNLGLQDGRARGRIGASGGHTLRRVMTWLTWLVAWLLIGMTSMPVRAEPALKIGSKRFTESYILGEVLRQTVSPYAPVNYLPGLGNTAIVFAALQAGSIDVYPEYVGTVEAEILHQTAALPVLQAALAQQGLGLAVPLGFNDTYAIAMRADESRRLGITRISDLQRFPQLRAGFSHEFLGRADGWPGLASRYRLAQRPVGLDHGVAYEALGHNEVDLIDVYSTDARIQRMHLQVLQDDLHFFPDYQAMLLYRRDVPQRFPAAWQALQTLQGRISEEKMIAMNAAAELDGKAFPDIARDFLAHDRSVRAAPSPSGSAPNAVATAAASASAQGAEIPSLASRRSNGLWRKLAGDDLWRLTRQHLLLVLVSVGAATLIGIPLGVLAASSRWLQQPVLALVGVLQTIPSLALLAMLIPLLGQIGTLPAMVALILYALLPVVRNTCIGLLEVSPGLRMAAMGLGLTRSQRLIAIELPLAAPVILAGLKTAAVMSVGTATIAAFIGAGGYGERIATGLALNDNATLLAGAIPAALLAIVTQALFELTEWWIQRRRRARAPA